MLMISMSKLSLVLFMCAFHSLHICVFSAANAHLQERVFVNGRSRPEVIKDMYERIERNDANAERAAAIKV